KATVQASTASRARLGKNGHRCGKGIESEFACRTFEEDSAGFRRKRRHRIGLRTRRIKRTCACKARDTNFPLDFRVVGLEVGVSDRPVDEGRARRWADFAALNEIDFMEAPEVCSEVITCTSDGTAVDKGALLFGLFVGRFAERVWLQLRMIG